jgi:hypothetical protein
MGLLISAVMGWFRTNPRNLVLIGGLLAVIAVLAFVYMKGRGDQAKREEARQKIAVAAAVKAGEQAGAKANAAAVKGALIVAQKEKELIDAVAQAPDSLPAPAAVAHGCQQLRQAGISTADVPACQSARR